MHVGGMLKGASASVGGHPVRWPFSLRPERHTFDDPNNCGISPLQPKLTPEEIELLRELKEHDRPVLDGKPPPVGADHLEQLGYVEAHTLNIQDLLYTITSAGRAALAAIDPET